MIGIHRLKAIDFTSHRNTVNIKKTHKANTNQSTTNKCQ